jgi:hypothetical protein
MTMESETRRSIIMVTILYCSAVMTVRGGEAVNILTKEKQLCILCRRLCEVVVACVTSIHMSTCSSIQYSVYDRVFSLVTMKILNTYSGGRERDSETGCVCFNMERRDIHREALKTPGKCNTVTVYLNAG